MKTHSAARDRYDRASSEVEPNGNARPRDTRRNLLEAADRALRARGLMGASTREIAREAGVADGTLYVHFHDRIDLFIALIQEHLPPYIEPLKRLSNMVGRRTVRANLAEVFEGALTWYEQMFPIFGALSADRDLCEALRRRLAERDEGPHLAIQALEQYLQAEQKLGRVNDKCDLRAAVLMLYGAAHYWTAIAPWTGKHVNYTREELTKQILKSFMAGLAPAKSVRLVRKRP
ncbi:MAG TPA: TetR/AcrR family transcriptional regulator [Bryobacteraceae bacterium]|nr:TetR/AcrR family transcriptional regulator [Bryobacteraceae bacterium]